MRQLLATRRRGFTLVELVISVSVMSVLMGGLAGAMVIATKAMDGESTETSRSLQAANVLARVSEDLNFAIAFSERTPTAVTFTVPDRDNNTIPEVIRYAWSGTSGDPLTVEYNNGSPRVVAENVHDFDLSYLLVTRSPPVSVSGVESAEQLLVYHNNGSTPYLELSTVGRDLHCAQCFRPTLPPDAMSWKITRIKIVAQKFGRRSGSNHIQIRAMDANNTPSDVVLEEVVFPESIMPGSLFWYQLSYSTLVDLDPETGMCIVILGSKIGTGQFLYESGGSPMTPQTHFVTSMDSGMTWSMPNATDDMIFLVYGTITTPGG